MARRSWEHVIGLGVAGNFAGHLEQAGEAADFKDLSIADERAPKGIFPFYIPGKGSHFLHNYPISDQEIRLGSDTLRHQIEPEVALLCGLEYDGDRIVRVLPRSAMAHNDCSIRREGANKISEKKNWGPASKGTSSQMIPIDRFEKGGNLDDYRIASYLLRENQLEKYGVDSAVSTYSYMYGELLDWLVGRLNDQKDVGPLENIFEWLRTAGHPAEALISIGATRYTDFGENTFLESGDQSIVILYDCRGHDEDAIARIARSPEANLPSGLSVLRQQVL